MNRNSTHTRAFLDLRTGLVRPAVLLAAIAALSSCNGGPNPGPSMRYDASSALPPLGERQAPPASEIDAGPAKDPDIHLMPLDPWERSILAQGAKQRAMMAAKASEAHEAAESQTRLRPQVVWNPNVSAAEKEPPVYSGPQGAPMAEGLMGPPSPYAGMQSTDLQPTVEQGANATPPVLKMADLIAPLKSQLAMQAADSNSPLREHLVAASLLMLDGQRRTDPASIADLTDREREVLAAYQNFYTRVGESLRTGAGVDAVVKQTGEIASTLNSAGQLRIADFRLCSRIVNFGLYDEIGSYKFPALRATPLLTYVEIEGFKSVPGGDGKFVTRVRHELELYTEREGELVYAWPAAPAEDICGKVRHDFFLPRQIQLPSNLTMGRYRLKVRIVDEQSQNQAESVVAFSIVAGGDVAVKN